MENISEVIQSKPSAERELLSALLKAKKTLGPSVPRLETGGHQIAMIATQHQLAGQSVFMPAAELAYYFSVAMQMIEELRPCGIFEAQHSQRIIDAHYRLNRATTLETNSFNVNVSKEAQAIAAGNPNADPDTVVIHAQVAAYTNQCAGLFDKLGRHTSRIERSLREANQAIALLQARRIAKRGDQYDNETSEAYKWYRKLAGITDRLLAQEAEKAPAEMAQATPLGEKGVSATPSKRKTYLKPLFCNLPASSPAIQPRIPPTSLPEIAAPQPHRERLALNPPELVIK